MKVHGDRAAHREGPEASGLRATHWPQRIVFAATWGHTWPEIKSVLPFQPLRAVEGQEPKGPRHVPRVFGLRIARGLHIAAGLRSPADCRITDYSRNR